MPYITKEQRHQLIALGNPVDHPGKLNFLVTELIKVYITTNGQSYQTYNDIIGVLECAKTELYRRRIAGYEDLKIQENGDVY